MPQTRRALFPSLEPRATSTTDMGAVSSPTGSAGRACCSTQTRSLGFCSTSALARAVCRACHSAEQRVKHFSYGSSQMLARHTSRFDVAACIEQSLFQRGFKVVDSALVEHILKHAEVVPTEHGPSMATTENGLEGHFPFRSGMEQIHLRSVPPETVRGSGSSVEP